SVGNHPIALFHAALLPDVCVGFIVDSWSPVPSAPQGANSHRPNLSLSRPAFHGSPGRPSRSLGAIGPFCVVSSLGRMRLAVQKRAELRCVVVSSEAGQMVPHL